MRLPFGRRTGELETKNRILTDAARKRAERIRELEHQVAQLEHQVARLRQQLESGGKRASELQAVPAQRAHLLNEKDEELGGLREVLTQRARSLNEKDEGIGGAREALTECSLRIRAAVHSITSSARASRLSGTVLKCSRRNASQEVKPACRRWLRARKDQGRPSSEHSDCAFAGHRKSSKVMQLCAAITPPGFLLP